MMVITLCMTVSVQAGSIHQLAHAGDLEQLQQAIAEDASLVDAMAAMGSPLNYALFGQHLSIVQCLLEHGADVNLRSPSGLAPLDLALLFGVTEIANVLLDHGADVATQNGMGRLPLNLAAELGRVDAVRKILQAGGSVDSIDALGTSPVMVATTNGHLDVVATLLNSSARVDIQEQQSGRSLLHAACLAGNLDIAKLVLSAGGRINKRDASGKTALYSAARYGHQQVADFLLDHGADQADNHAGLKVQSPQITREMESADAVAWYLKNRGWAVRIQGHLLVFDAEAFDVNRPTQPSLLNGFLTPAEVADQHLLGLYTCYHGQPGELTYVHKLADHAADAAFVHQRQDAFRAAEAYLYLEPDSEQDIRGIKVHAIDAFAGFPAQAYLLEADDMTIYYQGFNVQDPQAFISKVSSLVAMNPRGPDLAFVPIPEPGTDTDDFLKLIHTLKPQSICLLDPERREGLYGNVAATIISSGFSCEVFCAENPGDAFEYSAKH
ncbi:MAG: hypothetical protein GY835_03800 [bacterium]|nr:hypothetical protein [bacterium]